MKRILALLALVAFAGNAFPQQLLRDGSFESSGVWSPFEAGYSLDTTVHRYGASSARCVAATSSMRLGAQYSVTLNQLVPTPILVSGWSKADGVGGATDRDYSIYIDAVYSDGMPLWGLAAPFTAGSHDWQQRKVLVQPKKPLKSLTVYALFRNHAGAAWFDDFAVRELKGAGIFDGQAMALVSPRPGKPVAGVGYLRVGPQGQIGNGGFFIRDLVKGGDAEPVKATVVQGKDGVDLSADGFHATIHHAGDGLGVDGQLTGDKRAVTLYLAIPFKARGWQWGDDIRHSRTIVTNGEYSNLTSVSVGANGGISLYPFACVSNQTGGLVLSNGMGWPTVYRIFYNEATSTLDIAWDFSVSKSHPAEFHCRLDTLGPVEAKWGFRAAAARFYKANSEAFRRRVTKDGIWMPFTDPSKIRRSQDFGIAFHEGDNSIETDQALGIQSYRYVEPMSYWMPMASAEPRTYDKALRILANLAKAGNAEARATIHSGTKGPDGRLNMQFRNEPWCDGAVFVLNPNPKLPGDSTKAKLNYDVAEAAKLYARGMDGQYLDSLEGWSEYNDYEPAHLAACEYPLTFDSDLSPVVPQWFSTYAYASWLSDVLHQQSKLLFANSTPVQFSVFAGVLDVMGIETNWFDGNGVWRPDDDATFNMHRTLSYRRPYLLLQNTDYRRFTHDHVRHYFERSMFYGVFPSMFSADAATNPYWENAKLYDRDRDLFLRYIPMIKQLSSLGWEPVTYATATSAWIERYGARVFTMFNDSSHRVQVGLTLDPTMHGKKLVDLMTGEAFKPGSKIPLASEQCRVLELRP